MRFHSIIPAIAAALYLAGLAKGSPIHCDDWTRDLILQGKLPPEVCCSYGVCKGDVVTAMA